MIRFNESIRDHIKELLDNPDNTYLQRVGEIISFLKNLSPQNRYKKDDVYSPALPSNDSGATILRDGKEEIYS